MRRRSETRTRSARWGLRLAPVVVLIAVATRSEGQLRLTGGVEIGAARIAQSGIPHTGVMTGGGDLRIAGTRGAMSAQALAVTDGGDGTVQGALQGSLFVTPLRPAILELTATVGTFAASRQLPVTTAIVGARQLHPIGQAGAFYGVSAGRSAWAGETLPVGVGQVGGWWSRGGMQLVSTGSVTLSQSEYRTIAPSGTTRTVFDVHYADLAAAWRLDAGIVTLGVTGGARFGIENVEDRAGWAGVTATARVAPPFAVVVNAGRSLADHVRGIPASRYFTVAMRASSDAPRSAARATGPRLSITRSGDQHVVRVEAASATSVDIMADFTGWQPVSLSRVDGAWSTQRAIPHGIHRVLLRIDGGAWIPPANLARGRDDFGALVGLITVL